ncbi:AEC family transporter [Blautia schinkii]|nr:AEC family transporter [Blautia schinkii]
MRFFATTLNQMMLLFIFIIIGFMLNRSGIIANGADIVISRLENFVFVPALVINSFQTRCTVENLSKSAGSLVYSLLILGFSVIIGFWLAPRFAHSKEEIGIFRYSMAVTNFGFMGNSLVMGLLGEDALFNYLIFCLPMNLFIYSVGVIWLTAGKRKFNLGMLVNPMFISLIIGAVLGLTGCPLPSFLSNSISSAAACYSPLAMILTGYVIAKFDFKMLFSKKNIYVLSVLRLLILPVIILVIMNLFNVPSEIKVLGMFASAMPLGLNTIVFPAAYGGDETSGASMALISNIMGIITVPILLGVVLNL